MDNADTPNMFKRSVANDLSVTSRFPLDPSLTSGEISTWATPQFLNIIQASTDQLK
jgi:hypothetical protein